MITYLIDTDWVIDYLKGKTQIVEILSEIFEEGIAISVISLSELYDGIYGSKNREKQLIGLNAFLTGVEIIDVNAQIAQIFGEQRTKLRQQHNLIDNFDLMIASTRLCYDLKLLTNNIKHFGRIEGLQIGI